MKILFGACILAVVLISVDSTRLSDRSVVKRDAEFKCHSKDGDVPDFATCGYKLKMDVENGKADCNVRIFEKNSKGANEVFHAEFEIIRSGNEIKYIEVTCYCNGSLCNAKGKEKDCVRTSIEGQNFNFTQEPEEKKAENLKLVNQAVHCLFEKNIDELTTTTSTTTEEPTTAESTEEDTTVFYHITAPVNRLIPKLTMSDHMHTGVFIMLFLISTFVCHSVYFTVYGTEDDYDSDYDSNYETDYESDYESDYNGESDDEPERENENRAYRRR